MPFRIESLSPDHNRDAFDCGEDHLNDFLRRFALESGVVGLGTVWVAVEPDSRDVKGFYTLSSGHVERKQYKAQRNLPWFPRPVTLIGQLARDNTVRGQGVGEMLLVDALRKAVEASRLVGSMAVVIDASTPEGQTLYRQFGFEELYTREDGIVRLYRSMSDIEADIEGAEEAVEDGG